MSNDSFQAFMAKVQEDEDLRQALEEASGDSGIPAETFTAIAAAKGYEFTVEDVSSELDDAQLDAVAGGLARTLGRQESTGTLAYKVEISSFKSLAGALFLKLSG